MEASRSSTLFLFIAADGNTSSADGRYNGTATGNGTTFVADRYLGGVTKALECNSVSLWAAQPAVRLRVSTGGARLTTTKDPPSVCMLLHKQSLRRASLIATVISAVQRPQSRAVTTHCVVVSFSGCFSPTLVYIRRQAGMRCCWTRCHMGTPAAGLSACGSDLATSLATVSVAATRTSQAEMSPNLIGIPIGGIRLERARSCRGTFLLTGRCHLHGRTVCSACNLH